MKSAASSSAEPPISPSIMIAWVSGSFWNSGEAVDEVRSGDRVATDADTGRHADAALLQLVERLVGERSGAAHDADVRAVGGGQLCDLTGGDADVALAGADDAGAVRAEQARVRELALQPVVGECLVLGGDALGDAHHEADSGLGCFEDGARRELRRHGSERRVRHRLPRRLRPRSRRSGCRRRPGHPCRG